MWVTRGASTGALPKTVECARGTRLAQPPRVLWLRPWVVFGGGALAVVLLDWGEPVLMPVAVSLLLTFLLNPPVNSLQRWIGRAPAVVIVVSLTFLMLTALGWVLARQVTSLAADLPGYRQNIRQKVADVRALSRGGPVAQVQSTLEDIKQEIAKGEQEIAKGEAAKRPSSVVVAEPDSLLPIPTWVSSLFEPLGTAGLVVVLVVFMLLEQRDMRDRIVALMGDGHVARATKAVDEAGARLSQYLLMQTLINVIYGVMVGASLWFFGVPYPVLWAVVAAVLRFIPYVGPWIAAGAPIIVSLAALPGWTTPLYVAGTFLVLELITNMVLETVFYAGAAGVTQVALLISIAFWTWIWGPLGLLLATPLTVCLAVLGKYVPSLRGLSMLISDQPMLSPDAAFYQRVLANQIDDAREIVDRQADAQSAECAFDALLVPALSYAERDRAANRLSLEEERRAIETTRELAGALKRVWPRSNRRPANPPRQAVTRRRTRRSPRSRCSPIRWTRAPTRPRSRCCRPSCETCRWRWRLRRSRCSYPSSSRRSGKVGSAWWSSRTCRPAIPRSSATRSNACAPPVRTSKFSWGAGRPGSWRTRTAASCWKQARPTSARRSSNRAISCVKSSATSWA